MKLPGGVKIGTASYALMRALTSYWGTTTAIGNVGGTTIVDDGLLLEPSYAGHQVAIFTGGAWGQARRAATQVGNTITVPFGYTDLAGAPVQIPAGTQFVILKENWGLDIAALNVVLAAIIAALAAFPVLQETGGTLLATGGVDTVILVNAPAGVFAPKRVLLDLSNMVAGDNTIIRLYERIRLAGGLVLEDQVTYNGAQVPALIEIALGANRFGLQVTLQQTAGVMRNYDWAYFFES